jgi:tRNA pseudouridine32 synthase/23S rRNA pseudouridine746 synthase/23S rRNA pseudouridine1911/1915/1917 synthase
MPVPAPELPYPAWRPDDLPPRILFRDSNLIVLDKPPGLAVHGGPQTKLHLEGMLDILRYGLAKAPRLAHRLDRDTSGCLVLARHDKALSRMGRLFGAGKVQKTYWAIVAGCPPSESGRIELPLRKVSDKRGWRMVGDPQGMAAVTLWRVCGKAEGMTWLELKPQSGRTHQIRVHCASGLDCPIIGDPVYAADSTRPLHLHARALEIPYWADRSPLKIFADPPIHMQSSLHACGWATVACATTPSALQITQ